MSLKKWKCPKCHQITTKYAALCEHCDFQRGFFRWAFNYDNSSTWIIVSIWILIIIGLFMNRK